MVYNIKMYNRFKWVNPIGNSRNNVLFRIEKASIYLCGFMRIADPNENLFAGYFCFPKKKFGIARAAWHTIAKI